MSIADNPLVDGNGRLHIYKDDDRGIRLHLTGISRVWYSLFDKTVEVKSHNTTYVINANSAIKYFTNYGIPEMPSEFATQLYAQVIKHEAAKALVSFDKQLAQLEEMANTIDVANSPQTAKMFHDLIGSIKEYKQSLMQPSRGQDIGTRIQATKNELITASNNLGHLTRMLTNGANFEETARELNKAQALTIDKATQLKVQGYFQKARQEGHSLEIAPIENRFISHALCHAPAHAIFTREMRDIRKDLLVLSHSITDYIQKDIPAILKLYEYRFETIPRFQDLVAKIEAPQTNQFAFNLLASIVQKTKSHYGPPGQEIMAKWDKELLLLQELCHHDVIKLGLERTLDTLNNHDLPSIRNQAIDFRSVADKAVLRNLPKPLLDRMALIGKELERIANAVSVNDFYKESIKEVIGGIQEFRPKVWDVVNAHTQTLKELNLHSRKSPEELQLLGPDEVKRLSNILDALILASKNYK